MTLPAAAHYTGAFAGHFAGFSIPGIEIYEHDCRTGAPCEPCEVDEGDVCRPRWVNRQDHGALTRVNIARAGHPNAPYGGPDTGLTCGHPDLRTTNYGQDPSEYAGAMQSLPLHRRRELANQIRSSAKARKAGVQARQQAHQQAMAGAVAEVRSHREGGKHNHRAEVGPIGIRYIPMAGHSGSLPEDALIVTPGHSRR